MNKNGRPLLIVANSIDDNVNKDVYVDQAHTIMNTTEVTIDKNDVLTNSSPITSTTTAPTPPSDDESPLSIREAFDRSQEWRMYITSPPPPTSSTSAPGAWIRDLATLTKQVAPYAVAVAQIGQQIDFDSIILPNQAPPIPPPPVPPIRTGRMADSGQFYYHDSLASDYGQEPVAAISNNHIMPNQVAYGMPAPVPPYPQQSALPPQSRPNDVDYQIIPETSFNYNAVPAHANNRPIYPLPTPPILPNLDARPGSIRPTNFPTPPVFAPGAPFPTPPTLHAGMPGEFTALPVTSNDIDALSNRAGLATPSGKQRQRSGSAQGSAGCAPINCDMDHATLCEYTSPGNALRMPTDKQPAMSAWHVAERAIPNSLTGIFSDASGTGHFAYAGQGSAGTHDAAIYVMSSTRVETLRPARLTFAFYQAGVEGRLRVCINDLSLCPFVTDGAHINTDARQWRRAVVQLPAATQATVCCGVHTTLKDVVFCRYTSSLTG